MAATGLLICIVASLIPAAVYAWFVNWLDRHEKEPRRLLVLVFLWGALPAVVISILVEMALETPATWIIAEESLSPEIVGGSILAPLVEEIAKVLGVVLVLLLARREMDGILDGIVYGAMAGLGFAFSENILYFSVWLSEYGWGSLDMIVLLRTVPFGLNHAFFSGLAGAGVGAAYLSARSWVKVSAPAGGLLAGMTFHGIHNLGAILTDTSCRPLCTSFLFDVGGVAILLVLVNLVWRQENRWMAEQLTGEVSVEMYQLLTSWQMLKHAEQVGLGRLNQIRRAAVELAFKKHRLAQRGPDPKIEEEIAHYRRQLAELGARSPDQPSDRPTNQSGGNCDS